MNRQKWTLLGISLLVIIACIALVNQVLVRPALIGTLPEIKTAAAPPAPPPLARADLYTATMAKIRSKDNNQALLSSRQAVRNPFLWPGQKGKQSIRNSSQSRGSAKELQAGRAGAKDNAGKGAKDRLTLSMVIAGGRQNLALINNRFVSEGSTISGYQVKKIGDGYAMLAHESGTQKLTVGSGGILQKRTVASVSNRSPVNQKPVSPEPLQAYADTLEQILKDYLNPKLQQLK